MVQLLYTSIIYERSPPGVKFPSPPPEESSSFRLLIRATFESTAVPASAVEWTSSEPAVEKEMAWRMRKSALDSYLGDPTKKIHVQVGFLADLFLFYLRFCDLRRSILRT